MSNFDLVVRIDARRPGRKAVRLTESRMGIALEIDGPEVARTILNVLLHRVLEDLCTPHYPSLSSVRSEDFWKRVLPIREQAFAKMIELSKAIEDNTLGG